MFRTSRLRVHTCKIVLVTSLVWFVLDVAVIMYYSDCTTGSGWGCNKASDSSIRERDVNPKHSRVRDVKEAEAENEIDLGGFNKVIYPDIDFNPPKNKFEYQKLYKQKKNKEKRKTKTKHDRFLKDNFIDTIEKKLPTQENKPIELIEDNHEIDKHNEQQKSHEIKEDHEMNKEEFKKDIQAEIKHGGGKEHDAEKVIEKEIKKSNKEKEVKEPVDEINIKYDYDLAEFLHGGVDNFEGWKLDYPADKLQKWHAKPVVPEHQGQPGEMGKPVRTPPGQEALMKEKFKLNQFNLMASDSIHLNRSLPDVRLEGCKTKNYPPLMPTTSIVIVFHNEAWSTLLRTVWSIINRSPRELLEEIILVDDASERDYLGKELEDHCATLPVPVHVLRTPGRNGLIRARLLGAQHVKGQVITFLDAHVECTEGWLEPLLARIAEDRTRVVCPIIDVISDETFEYVTASDMTWGGFNWKLNFRWYRVPQREMERRNGDRTQPLRTPTMAGGLFSMDKDYFNKIGRYDEGMDIWGGENLEMSFRVWMCGGTLEIATCSHVGHVFRKSTPYTFPGGTSKIVNKNNARLAEVWLDDWKEFYYSINPGARSVDYGDVSPRRELRQKLHCKSFRWFLENIYPESQMPLDYFYLGEIRNAESQSCLDTLGRKSGENLGTSYCHGLGGNQVFAYTKRQQIMSDDNCLDSSNPNGPVKLVRCHGMGGNQMWTYTQEDLSIRHVNSGRCLQKPDARDVTLPVLKPCDRSLGQQWIMKGSFKWQAN